MSSTPTNVVPTPPPRSMTGRSNWNKAKAKRKTSTMLMLRVKQAKERMEKEMMTEAETLEKQKVGLKFAHIMYILKQQRKNKEYFDLIVFCIFVSIYLDDSGEEDDHSDSAHIVETNMTVKMLRAQVSKLRDDIGLIKKIVVSTRVESAMDKK